MSEPDNEIPAVLPFTVILGRTPDLAVALLGLRAYSAGISFDLAVRSRRDLPSELYHSMHVSATDNLMVGVELADGRRASTLDRADDPWGPGQPDELRLTQGSGGGGGRTYAMSYYLTPVPPAGPVTFVCAWPAQEIPETTTVIEAAQLAPFASFADAASQAVELWPWEPEPEPERPPLGEAAGGWFGDTARRLRGESD